jgi:hypothetical protein
MNANNHHYIVTEIPDQTHYKYAVSYEGSVRQHILLRSEHLLRMTANLSPGEITLALRYVYDPEHADRPQDRMQIHLDVKATQKSTSSLIQQMICHGPLAEFYDIRRNSHPFRDWRRFQAVTEIIRLEEGLRPVHPPGLDLRKLNDLIPDVYYCVHPFKPREDNDYSMLDKTCSFLKESFLLEMMIQPVSKTDERECHYREIVKLMAINSYNREDYIIDADQLDPFKTQYEQGTGGNRDVRAKDPIADDFLRIHRDFHKNLRCPQLLFNIKVWSPSQEISHIIASTVAESAFKEGSYRLIDYGIADPFYQASQKASEDMALYTDSCHRAIWDVYQEKGLFRLSHMTSVDEFKGLFRLPVAGQSPFRCLWRSTDYHRKNRVGNGILLGHRADANAGDAPKLPSKLNDYLETVDPSRIPVLMPIDILAKHMFVAGVPGSGKTTAIFNLLVQLFQHGVPFLVIEPGKTEYRQLKFLADHADPKIRALSQELRIYTPGKDDLSPFRFNPFQYPEGITRDEHIGQLLTCFEASMPLGGPLQALLAESLERVYSGDDNYRRADQSQFPNMLDLVDTAKITMADKGYEGEVRSNLSAAIDVRLSSLTRLNIGRIFDCRHSMPSVRELLAHPSIIEVQNLNPDQVCLLSMFLLSAVLEEIRISRTYGKVLQHVIIIEEAHNVVGRMEQSHPSSEFADPKAYAAEHIVRMLAEIRALGEGIIIADQLPSAVAASVVKNTGTKLAHRLVSLADREDLGGAMLLQGEQMEEIARLEPGHAYYFTEGLYAPLQINGLDAQTFLRLNEKSPPDNKQLQDTIAKEEWFIGLKKQRCGEKIQALAEALNLFDKTVGHLTNNFTLYTQDLIKLQKLSKKEDTNHSMYSLRGDVESDRKKLIKNYKQFFHIASSLPEDIKEFIDSDTLNQYRQIVEEYREREKKALNLESSLKKLKQNIHNFIRKDDQHESKRN